MQSRKRSPSSYSCKTMRPSRHRNGTFDTSVESIEEVEGSLQSSVFFDSLYEKAEAAYRIARREVFDHIPPGTSFADYELTDRQRIILLDLDCAEADLRIQRESGRGSAYYPS